jgi:hypothetical protein
MISIRERRPLPGGFIGYLLYPRSKDEVEGCCRCLFIPGTYSTPTFNLLLYGWSVISPESRIYCGPNLLIGSSIDNRLQGQHKTKDFVLMQDGNHRMSKRTLGMSSNNQMDRKSPHRIRKDSRRSHTHGATNMLQLRKQDVNPSKTSIPKQPNRIKIDPSLPS